MLQNFQLIPLEAESYQEIIKEIAQEINATHLMDDEERIYELITKREEKGNVIIPGRHIALIHFRAEDTAGPFVSAYRLKDFIEIKGVGYSSEEVDTFLVMLARKDESNYILELLGKISVALLENDYFAEVLRFGDLKDIRSELVEILNKEEES